MKPTNFDPSSSASFLTGLPKKQTSFLSGSLSGFSMWFYVVLFGAAMGAIMHLYQKAAALLSSIGAFFGL